LLSITSIAVRNSRETPQFRETNTFCKSEKAQTIHKPSEKKESDTCMKRADGATNPSHVRPITSFIFSGGTAVTKWSQTHSREQKGSSAWQQRSGGCHEMQE
jgi:hypothetical protein